MAGRRMGEPAAAFRRGSLPQRIVEGRIHQHPGDRIRGEPGRREGARRGGRIEGDGPHPRPQSVELRVFGGERREIRIDLDQRHRDVGGARRHREAGGPDPGPEVDHVLAGLRRACRRQQDRIMPDPVPPPRLTQPQGSAQHRILAQCAQTLLNQAP